MTKPYTLPDDAPDSAFIRTYWRQVARDRRWLAGLRRPDGSPYLVGQGRPGSPGLMCENAAIHARTSVRLEPVG